MGELVFIGLGLYDELGLSLRGQVEARTCDEVFAELYTSVMPGLSIQSLSQTVGRRVEVLSRREVEEPFGRSHRPTSTRVRSLLPWQP